MPSGFVIESATSKSQVMDILKKVLQRGARKLERLRVLLKPLFPGVQHDIPKPEESRISKLGGGGAVTSDNCIGAMKVKRVLVKRCSTQWQQRQAKRAVTGQN
eukprot:3423867-Pleurochrysis_carterae.AAC.3